MQVMFHIHFAEESSKLFNSFKNSHCPRSNADWFLGIAVVFAGTEISNLTIVAFDSIFSDDREPIEN